MVENFEKGKEMSPSPVEQIEFSSLERSVSGRPAVFSSTWQEIIVVLTATMAVGQNSITAGIVTVNSNFIGEALNMTTAEITWLSASSSLAAGSFLLLFARIADLFGRRNMLIGSFFIFSIITLGAGFAKSGILLDVLNGLMGLMAAAAVPPAQGMLAVIYDAPSTRKNKVFACFSAGNPIGFVVGIISGGIVNQIFNWRAAFWWLALLYFIFTVFAIFFIPSDTTEKVKFNRETLKRFDIPGSLLVIAGTGLFSAALSLAPDAPEGWKTGYVLALLIVGIALVIVFLLWELYVDDPLIPLSIFKNRDLNLLLAVLLLGFIGFAPGSFWIALYMQRVWHVSALKVAVYLLPMAIGGILVNIVAALILHRVSNKLIMFIGAFGYVIAFTLFAVNRTSYGYWPMIFIALLLTVVGADLEFNVTNMYVMSSLPKSQQSIASGIFQTLTRLSLTIGMAVTTAIYDSAIKAPDTGFHAGDPIRPYSAVFWFALGASAICLPMVPFLKVGTQGNRKMESMDSKLDTEQPSIMAVKQNNDEKK